MMTQYHERPIGCFGVFFWLDIVSVRYYSERSLNKKIDSTNMDAIDLFAGAGGFSTEAEATSIAISIDSAELHDENISAIPGAGMLSVGQWYWVLTDEDGQVEADDDDSEESEPGNLPDLIDHASVSALPKPPVEGAWLAAW